MAKKYTEIPIANRGRRRENLGFWLGDSSLKENGSDMSEDAAKAIQSGDSEVDKLRKRTPGASLWFYNSPYTSTRKIINNDDGEVTVLYVPERSEPKPQIEKRPSGATIFSKSNSSLSSLSSVDRPSEDMVIGDRRL